MIHAADSIKRTDSSGVRDAKLPLILVLMPVYNGEKFLPEQIDSILAQTHKNLMLICRDDQSSDTSLQILQSYVARFPHQVQLLQDAKGNLGASGSFSELMQWALANTSADHGVYIALADQDDTWRLDKLERCLAAMSVAEQQLPGVPVLVHSDLRVVGVTGAEIAPSLMQYQGLDPARIQFSAQLISNTVTGCTSLMNMTLLEKALPVPPQAVMHDWWLSLVTSAFGRLVFVPQALVEYRQHGRNTLGAREHKKLSLNWQTLRKLFRLKQTPEIQVTLDSVSTQAAEFLNRYSQELTERKRLLTIQTIQFSRLNIWRQRWIFRARKLKKN